MHVYLVSLTTVMFNSCKINSFHSKLLTPSLYLCCCNTFYTHSYSSCSLYSSSHFSACLIQYREFRCCFLGTTPLNDSSGMWRADSEIFWDGSFHIERVKRRELLCLLVMVLHMSLFSCYFSFPKDLSSSNVMDKIVGGKLESKYQAPWLFPVSAWGMFFLCDKCETLIYSLKEGYLKAVYFQHRLNMYLGEDIT